MMPRSGIPLDMFVRGPVKHKVVEDVEDVEVIAGSHLDDLDTP